MKMNQHYNELKASYLFVDINHRVAAFQKAHPDREVIRLGIGDVTRPLAGSVVKAMQEAVAEMGTAAGFHGYGPEQGYDFLREAVQGYYAGRGVRLEADEIFISDGAKSDLANILGLFSEENTVLVPDPVYPTYVDDNVTDGRKIVYAPTSEANGFLAMPDPAVRADIIYICSPNNPTGAVMPREDLEAVAEVLRGTDIVVLSDEIYAELTYGPRHVSIASLPGMRERTVVVNGFSKSYAMTGWRLGYACGPEPILRVMTKIHQSAIMSAPTTSQYAAVVALRECDNEIEQMREEYNMRRRLVVKGFNDLGLTCFEPQGAFYIFPSIQSTGMTSQAFCSALLEAKHVAVIPGAAFGASGEGYCRVSYAYSVDHLREALKRIGAFLKERGLNQ